MAYVVVGGFFAVVVREVAARWQKRIADAADRILLRGSAKLARTDVRFESDYRKFLLADLRYMDEKGLAQAGPFTPEHDDVFENVDLAMRPVQEVGTGIVPGRDRAPARRQKLGDFLGRQERTILAVVGGPGTGKTTLLRHAARQACRQEPTRKTRNEPLRNVPVLLYLREHAGAITADPSVSVAALARKRFATAPLSEPAGWLDRQLRAGRCLVLLDGLDEVARKEDRLKVSEWVERQISDYQEDHFVVSSRPEGYDAARVNGALIAEVCELVGR